MEATAGVMDPRQAVIQEIRTLPDELLWQVLTFARFLKQQFALLTPEERFDYMWMMARQIGERRGITDEEIIAEVAAVRT